MNHMDKYTCMLCLAWSVKNSVFGGYISPLDFIYLRIVVKLIVRTLWILIFSSGDLNLIVGRWWSFKNTLDNRKGHSLSCWAAAKHLDAQRDRPFAAAQGDKWGPLSKSVLLCETAWSAMYAIMHIDYEMRTSSYPPMKAEKSVSTIVGFYVLLA